ncbi:hypothetical protein GX411_08660 [Candidatus Fermentibacteria bacterium]|nr:hypothetical protein [Candidatus Fermentibacteria bacterium]
MKVLSVVGFLIACSAQAQGYQYWNFLRHSALLPGQNMTFRVENPSGSGIQNYLLYEGASGVSSVPMSYVLDGPMTVTASVPGPTGSVRRYGFRYASAAGICILPVAIAPGADPDPADLTQLSTDPVGDEIFGYANLDLTEYRTGFSSTRIFASLSNAGGGFPTNSGLTFFGYMFAMADPALADPDTVFAILYTTNQPGIITPGLYRITGTGFGDLEKIGEIEHEIFASSNTLLVSCSISDLMSDPYFMEWYDPSDPAIGIAAFTQRITLIGGAQQADQAQGGDCFPRAVSVPPASNTLPVLSGFSLSGSGPTAAASIIYTDANGHCPVISEIVFDGAETFPMYPLTLVYTSPVTYRTEEGIGPLASGDWETALLRFSDNQTDMVELEVQNTGLPEDDGAPPLALSLSPCPSTGPVGIVAVIPEGASGRVSVYDVRGSLVRELCAPPGGSSASVTWDGRNADGERSSPGIYCVRLEAGGSAVTGRVVLTR